MSQELKSLQSDNQQMPVDVNPQDKLSRIESIRNKWNDSVRSCRLKQAQLMQLKLATIVLATADAA